MNTYPKIQFTSRLKPFQVKKWNEDKAYEISLGLKPKLIWVNKKQMKMLNAFQKTQGYLMGRGGGKSKGMHYSMAQKIIKLPRGSFFLAAPSFEQLLSMSLKGLEDSWKAFGWEKDVDYHFFKPPLEGWEVPHSAPESWKNCIVHRNGSYIQLLSDNRRDTRRGGSFDGGDIDEAAWCQKSFFEDVIIPSMRGNIEHFKNNPLWQTIRIFTSMPRSTEGLWIFDMIEDKYKDECLVRGEGNTIDFFFLEGNAFDNIDIWGEDGIRRLKATMSHLKYQIEVLNMRIKKAERGFYPRFNEERHVKRFPIENMIDKNGRVFKGLKWLKRNEPIDLSFDFGGWFTCCIAEQYFERENVDRTYREFFKDGDDGLKPVVQDFCKFFDDQGQRVKHVNVYGEPRGHNNQSDGPTLYKKIEQYLLEFGWTCDILVEEGSKTDEHELRHEDINMMLSEEDDLLPRIEIDEDGCPNLITTLQTTEINPDFKKNKSKEKDREFPQQLAPHLTDAFDYKKVQKFQIDTQEVGRASTAGTT
jgi:hypothetical protein